MFEFLIAVEGNGVFPVDALRMEQLWPATEADSARINSTLHYEHLSGQLVHHIRLCGHKVDAMWMPNEQLWHDRGWHIVECNFREI